VYPGQPGKSHDHTFIGNDTTNAFSTLTSLLGQSSSCRRPGDMAGYWVPTPIDAAGKAITPRSATVYYRRHTLDPVQPFSQGFKLIAGNSKATAPQGLMITSWNCGPVAEIRPTSTIPTCPDAKQQGLALHVQFPNCWDGVNLDSPDHQSHMAYSGHADLQRLAAGGADGAREEMPERPAALPAEVLASRGRSAEGSP